MRMAEGVIAESITAFLSRLVRVGLRRGKSLVSGVRLTLGPTGKWD